MFRNTSQDDKKTADYASPSCKGLILPEAPRMTLQALSLTEIMRLDQAVYSGESNSINLSHLNRPVGLEQFEMLEAELQNQGILSKLADDQSTLAMLANHEATFWRWRAQRYGARRLRTDFEIDVPRYILQRSYELATLLDDPNREDSLGQKSQGQAAPWKFSFRSEKSILEELRYLNSFAAYINGAYDQSSNRYQRGCNLILQVLSHSSKWGLTGEIDLVITLPVSKDDFMNRIKPYRFGRRKDEIISDSE